jgi:hypothetical protein
MSARAAAIASDVLLVFFLASFSSTRAEADNDDGIVRVKSAYPMAETITRLKTDVIGRGIILFSEIDQSDLAAKAGVEVRRWRCAMSAHARTGCRRWCGPGSAAR